MNTSGLECHKRACDIIEKYMQAAFKFTVSRHSFSASSVTCSLLRRIEYSYGTFALKQHSQTETNQNGALPYFACFVDSACYTNKLLPTWQQIQESKLYGVSVHIAEIVHFFPGHPPSTHSRLLLHM